MKRIKKLASLLLAMMMVLSMGVTAFATEPTDTSPNGETLAGEGSFTITINDTTEGYVYQAYQIFSGNLNVVNGTKTLSNIVWGSGVDAAKVAAEFPDKTAAQVAQELSGKAFDSDEAKAFAQTISGCLNTAATGTSREEKDSEGNVTGYTISGLTVGYYLVLNSSVPATDGAYTRYMMEVVGNVAATPKRAIPTPDKKIVEQVLDCNNTEEGHVHNEDCYKDSKVDANEASIGDEINYEITGTMPSNIADYKTYYYKFTDTLSKGLTYKEGSIHVTVNGVDVTNYFYKGVGTYSETAGTEIEVSILDVKALSLLTDPAVGDITSETTVVLTYTATLNENAVIAGDGNPNDVKLTYSTDP